MVLSVLNKQTTIAEACRRHGITETTFARAEGTPVRYLRSTFITGEDKSFCLFEQPSADR